jgi:hypothetical protein
MFFVIDYRCNKSFLIKKGSSIVAKITPEENYLSTSISSLNYFFAQAPKLEDDIDSFKQDIFYLKNNLENEGSKWD